MSADAFSFKKGAQLPSRIIQLSSASAFDLATAASITFVYRTKGVVERKTINVVTFDATAKTVTVDFDTTSVGTAGKYEWQVEVVWAGKKMEFPEKGFNTFSVTENIE